jgi:hypothetical protein
VSVREKEAFINIMKWGDESKARTFAFSSDQDEGSGVEKFAYSTLLCAVVINE